MNFDYDLLDGLVVATVVGAYCPFLVETHLSKMYARVETAEQCFHNALKLTEALRFIGIEYDINVSEVDMYYWWR